MKEILNKLKFIIGVSGSYFSSRSKHVMDVGGGSRFRENDKHEGGKEIPAFAGIAIWNY